MEISSRGHIANENAFVCVYECETFNHRNSFSNQTIQWELWMINERWFLPVYKIGTGLNILEICFLIDPVHNWLTIRRMQTHFTLGSHRITTTSWLASSTIILERKPNLCSCSCLRTALPQNACQFRINMSKWTASTWTGLCFIWERTSEFILHD